MYIPYSHNLVLVVRILEVDSFVDFKTGASWSADKLMGIFILYPNCHYGPMSDFTIVLMSYC